MYFQTDVDALVATIAAHPDRGQRGEGGEGGEGGNSSYVRGRLPRRCSRTLSVATHAATWRRPARGMACAADVAGTRPAAPHPPPPLIPRPPRRPLRWGDRAGAAAASNGTGENEGEEEEEQAEVVAAVEEYDLSHSASLQVVCWQHDEGRLAATLPPEVAAAARPLTELLAEEQDEGAIAEAEEQSFLSIGLH